MKVSRLEEIHNAIRRTSVPEAVSWFISEIDRAETKLERYENGIEVDGYLEYESLHTSIGQAQSLVEEFGTGDVKILVMKGND